MTQRTCNIILCCKGHGVYASENYAAENKDDPFYAIKRYMGDECGCPWQTYTLAKITQILWTALEDYIDTADSPRSVLMRLRDSMSLHYGSIPEAICGVFATAVVQDEDGGYVNGFTEELLHQGMIDLGEAWR